MSTQPFSKVFLFPNNKRKTENNFPITTGPAHGNDWPTAAFGLRNRAKGKGDGLARGSGPRPTWPSSAEARRHATPRRRSRRHGGAAAASGPAAVAGHDRANRRERWVRKKMANPSGLPKGMEKGRRKPFHDEAKRGGDMTDDGENAQGRYTLLKWCPCSEH